MKRNRLIAIVSMALLFCLALNACASSEPPAATMPPTEPPAPPFSEAAFLQKLEETVAAQETEYTMTVAPEAELDSRIRALVEEARETYFFGKNTDEITWVVSIAENAAEADITVTVDLDTLFSDVRDTAAPFSPEILDKKWRECVFAGVDCFEMVFPNDGTVSAENLTEAVDNNAFLKSALGYYYFNAYAWYEITEYSDYIELIVSYFLQDDRVPYEELIRPKNEREAIEMLAANWDNGEPVALYFPYHVENAQDFAIMIGNSANDNNVDYPYRWGAIQIWPYHYEGGTEDFLFVVTKEQLIDAETIDALRGEMMAEARRIADSLTETDPKERIKELVGILAERSDYDDDLWKASEDEIAGKSTLTVEQTIARTAHGALVKGSTVCTGFARSFKLICDMIGIECYVISGEVNIGHEWNVVFLDGEKYYVDVTYVDAGLKEYELFGEELYQRTGYKPRDNIYVPEKPAS